MSPDRRTVISRLVVVFVVLSTVATVGAAPVQEDPRGQNGGITTIGVNGSAAQQANQTFVWRNGSLSIEVQLRSFDGTGDGSVCLNASQAPPTNATSNNTTTRSYGCSAVGASGQHTVTFDVDDVRFNRTGNVTFDATYRAGDRVDRASTTVHVMAHGGDTDKDGLTNEKELQYNTSLVKTDTDGDTLLDGSEVTEYETDPTKADTDDDGARDGIEISAGTEPRVVDTDGDGIHDGRELNRYNTDPTKADHDGDGLNDSVEINKYGIEPTNEDTDGDELNDGAEIYKHDTDPNDEDTDGDGVSDGEEVDAGTDPNDPRSYPRNSGSPVGPGGPLDRDASLMFLWAGLGVAVALGVGLVLYSQRGLDDDVLESSAPVDVSEAGGAAGGGASMPRPDPELLPPNERVHLLLSEHGGRLKQSEIVDLTDWSKAKVSRTLSEMEDEGEIERVRIGRENVVTFPDVDLD